MNPNRKPNLRRSLAHSLRHNALIVSALVATIAVSAANAADDQPARPDVVDSPAALVEAHDCWTGAAPEGVEVPGHVVVTRDGVPTYGGTRLVDLALDQTFNGADHNLTIHAFCR